ncbi:probable sodium/metabolite cotransporter BASS1, chloroplastic isoform X2 [Ziziphus jujuba]|uniref:Probable sodium/metabolite cotransporter BASS1, chloroplastic isoform X2 n=1 Tax=Ziziphus jujuba TaxID=326968 RepID=A0ABM3IIH9_ZIZJJ|nr:probable sodium/metabolite cotransporter BASS1, chloroplastic isoform X2 [Ziziphus jujuba]
MCWSPVVAVLQVVKITRMENFLHQLPAEMHCGCYVLCSFQSLVRPISGFLVCKLLNLPSHYAAGLILVGCCPGSGSANHCRHTF